MGASCSVDSRAKEKRIAMRYYVQVVVSVVMLVAFLVGFIFDVQSDSWSAVFLFIGLIASGILTGKAVAMLNDHESNKGDE